MSKSQRTASWSIQKNRYSKYGYDAILELYHSVKETAKVKPLHTFGIRFDYRKDVGDYEKQDLNIY